MQLIKSFIFICGLAFNQSWGQSFTQAKIYTTYKDSIDSIHWIGKRIDSAIFQESIQPLESEISIFVNSHKTHQTYIGIGGAITDAVAETYAKLIPSDKQYLLDLFFHKTKGLKYSLIRTNMNSCDFSSESYSYIKENDTLLSSFNISHDLKYRIPMIKDALNLIGKDAKIYISPWSPPAFMKSNHSMLHGGKLKIQYYHLWAKYFIKYIQELEKNKVPVWGLTVQNEPMATQIWESCIYTAEQERDFIKYHLGPMLHKNKLGNKKLIVWDHNRDLIYHRVNTILTDKVASKYVWGVGYHWYETWTGAEALHENLGKISTTFPEVNILFTEGCKEKFNIQYVKNWDLGEKYAMNMIRDFNQNVVGWTDWNLFLDEKGGPNHVGNFCFAPLHVKPPENHGVGKSTFLFTNAYDYIGHFSKFLQKDAKRVDVSVSRSTLISTSFDNPDKSLIVIVLNTSDKKTDFFLYINSKMAKISILPRAIQTIEIK